MKTVILLIVSNIFMTFAWYGHLRYRSTALWLAVLAGWGIALVMVTSCFSTTRALQVLEDGG